MNRTFRLFVLGSLLAYVGARLRRRTGAHAHIDDSSGVSPSTTEVDPEDLTEFGEGIDPEAVRHAHAEPALLRELLPQQSKNLP